MFASSLFSLFRTKSDMLCSDAPEHNNHRGMPRFGVKWKVVAAIDGRTLYHGHTKDISVSGASILLPLNLAHVKTLDLHIHIPSAHPFNESHLLHVGGKLTYAVYDRAANSFRAGIEFQEFKSNHDVEFLTKRLALHAPPITQ
jgi:hypothetical protein